ncbi:MAG: hypothetical protein ABEK03_03815 [Candidatus Bipolaricaulia bacterium]
MVQTTTRSGSTFLQSRKEQSTVTVSLRNATDSYVQSYVSITNDGSTPIPVQPENITVVTARPSERSFSAYAPGEVPDLVAQSARNSARYVRQMDATTGGGTSAAVGGVEKTQPAGYGSDEGDEEDRSYMDLMLKEQSLSPQDVASGLVYTPFNRSIKAFRLKVSVGKTTHVFRFEARSVEDG